ncbi:MAG: FHA domain-containing protein [Deltaproteobacteria bacterium]|nr:FHA domain-containing protein [Deltaproteobacteria bacterium]MBW1854089.1 FHA domain-containing protein [Deltaproteobacteria bacterium]
MTKLHIIDGAMAGQFFELKTDTILIGRSADNDVQIKDAAVSRKHLKITRQEDKLFVEDLGSQNGTWVKGQLIRPKEAVEVEPGDSIVIGDVLVNLGKKPLKDYLATQYSIDLSDLAGEGGESLLHKSTITTNRRRLEKIHEVSTVLSQSLEIDEICEKIMDSLFYCLKEMDCGIVLLIDSNTGELEEKIRRSRDNNKDIKVSYSRTIVNRVIRESKALMMADTRQEDQEELSDSIEMMRLRSIMCTPLISKSGIRGVIYVHSTSALPGFPKDNLFLLAGLSIPAAVALEKALLYSERKQAEEALGDSVRQWHTTFDAMSDAVSILDLEGKILRCNKAMSELLGKPFTEILGQRCWELVHCTSQPIEGCPVLLMRNTRIRETMELPMGERWFEVVADPVFDKQDKIIEAVHIISDITPRKQAEEALQKAHEALETRVEERTAELMKSNRKLETEIKDRKLTEKHLKNTLQELQKTKDMLIRSEKLAAIGQLTAGIAHEILNPVNIMSIRLQMLNDSRDVSDKVRNSLNICKSQLDRISDITRNLGQFSRVSEQSITMNNLNKIIEEIVNMCAPQFKVEDISTDIQYHPDLPLIPLDKDKVQQVILNIISNAVLVMSGQATRMLRITTKPTPSNGFAQIIISDTGTGIVDSYIDKVFDPFFTTSDPGKGVGLGLYISYGIIKDHGGKIWAENNEWGGATFIIELPIKNM